MQVAVFDEKGKESGKVKLPEGIFDLRWNGDLVHQVIVSMQSNARAGTAHTKDRSEKRGGGRKPWRQKGTGRARHGSRRSPLWTGGGVTFGPRKERNYDKKINKKMKSKALFTVLSRKLKDGEILFVDKIDTSKAKTKIAQDVVNNLSKIEGHKTLGYKRGKRAVFVSPEKNDNLVKMFRNIKSISTEELRNVNPLQLVNYQYVVFIDPKKSFEGLSKRK